jgi:hypothetical protein
MNLLSLGNRSSVDSTRGEDNVNGEDETVVDADQGNSTSNSLLPPILSILLHELTRNPLSAHPHHIPTPPWRRPKPRYIAYIHSGAAIDAGTDNKVRLLGPTMS